MAAAPRPGGRAGRERRVDALRGMAILAMVVASCAPTPGPFQLAELTTFLATPLFAFLIGVGAQLGNRGWRGLVLAFVRAGVRAAVLVLLGVWLSGRGAHVDVVLTYLALPTVLAPVLARLPSSWLGGLAVGCWAASPTLQEVFRARHAIAVRHGDELGARLWDATFTGVHYRLTSLLVFICLGILVQRWVAKGAPAATMLGVAVVCAGGASALMAARQTGRVPFAPYAGTHEEMSMGILLTLAVALVWFAAVPRDADFLRPLADAGAMSLSIYTILVLYLAWYVTAYAPHSSDDSWTNVGILCVGAVLLPPLWRRLASREPWSRGPIEGPVSLVNSLFGERR